MKRWEIFWEKKSNDFDNNKVKTMTTHELLQRCNDRITLSKEREAFFASQGDAQAVRQEQALQFMTDAFRAKLRLEMNLEGQKEVNN